MSTSSTSTVTPDVTMSVEAIGPDIIAFLSSRCARQHDAYFVVRRREGVLTQVFTSGAERAVLAADARACAATWSATYVESGGL